MARLPQHRRAMWRSDLVLMFLHITGSWWMYPLRREEGYKPFSFFRGFPMGFGGIVIFPPSFGCVDRLKLQDDFFKGKGERRVFSLMDLWPTDFNGFYVWACRISRTVKNVIKSKKQIFGSQLLPPLSWRYSNFFDWSEADWPLKTQSSSSRRPNKCCWDGEIDQSFWDCNRVIESFNETHHFPDKAVGEATTLVQLGWTFMGAS